MSRLAMKVGLLAASPADITPPAAFSNPASHLLSLIRKAKGASP